MRILWSAAPRAGDIVLFAHEAGFPGWAITTWTGSIWSHAALIVGPPDSTGLFVSVPCVEVVDPIRIQRLADYKDRPCWIVRPYLGLSADVEPDAETGAEVAERTLAGPGKVGTDYPTLSLLGHALPRWGPFGWLRRRLVGRPVCSQVACIEWHRVGVRFFGWDPMNPFDDVEDYEPIDPQVWGISPAEIAENARRGRMRTIGERPYGIGGSP